MALVEAWMGRHRREAGGLLGRHARRARTEIPLGGGFGAEHAAAPFDDIEVQLENALLIEDGFEQDGDDGLCGLAPIASRRRQEQVLGKLLRDRRTTGDDASLPLV